MTPRKPGRWLPKRIVAGLAVALGLMGVRARADFDWNLPKGFPRPAVPVDNPMTAAKVELGRYLFYDTRPSVNGKESCGSCHRQELAFTDGRALARGATGQLHPRSSMSLVNVAYAQRLTWADPALTSLESQALLPMLGTDPIELGLKGHEQEFLAALRRDAVYTTRFPAAFPGEGDAFTLSNVTKAIAAFERSIVSMRSPYDRYRWGGDSSAISDAMHDGSLATLEEVIDHYAAGGKFDHPNKSRIVRPFALTACERRDLVEFLKSLTDEELLHDPRWSDPWPAVKRLTASK